MKQSVQSFVQSLMFCPDHYSLVCCMEVIRNQTSKTAAGQSTEIIMKQTGGLHFWSVVYITFSFSISIWPCQLKETLGLTI